ncbi:MAG: hypothetical protein ACRC50_03215 [Gaiella sp.]
MFCLYNVESVAADQPSCPVAPEQDRDARASIPFASVPGVVA